MHKQETTADLSLSALKNPNSEGRFPAFSFPQAIQGFSSLLLFIFKGVFEHIAFIATIIASFLFLRPPAYAKCGRSNEPKHCKRIYGKFYLHCTKDCLKPNISCVKDNDPYNALSNQRAKDRWDLGIVIGSDLTLNCITTGHPPGRPPSDIRWTKQNDSHDVQYSFRAKIRRDQTIYPNFLQKKSRRKMRENISALQVTQLGKRHSSRSPYICMIQVIK